MYMRFRFVGALASAPSVPTAATVVDAVEAEVAGAGEGWRPRKKSRKEPVAEEGAGVCLCPTGCDTVE